MILYIFFILTFIINHRIDAENSLNTDFITKLDNALNIVSKAISDIYKEWEIEKYPNFLKSCHMHKISWELLKLRYQKKILEAELVKDKATTFVISFTGSSVTAGHDSHFNYSTPIVTGKLMESSFKALNIELDSRNVALGNNPCTPYDVCVKYFAGLDADIVHWEQSYFCEGRDIMEQFIRQAITIPSKPIVVFSESNTGHWQKDVCKNVHGVHTIDHNEMQLLNSSHLHLVAELNKDEFHRAFGYLDQYMKMYHSAGIQTFHHLKHDKYACMGPYIPTWMEGAASWHPSVIGHRLRAAHHSYFWLLILSDAIQGLKSSLTHRVIDAAHKDVEAHLIKLTTAKNEPPRHKTIFPDNAKCYTDYEPRPIREASLKSKVIHGLAIDDTQKGWKFVIYELLVDPNLVKRGRQQGYHDYKHLLYGDESSGPLSIDLELSKESPIILCETPGIWGSLPSGFHHFWENHNVEIYITFDVKDKNTYVFNKDESTKLSAHYNKDLEICAEIKDSHSSTSLFKSGSHVLIIVPKTTTKVIFAWLVTA